MLLVLNVAKNKISNMAQPLLASGTDVHLEEVDEPGNEGEAIS